MSVRERSPERPHRRARRVVAILAAAVVAAWCGAVTGCQKRLFPLDSPRTQYDLYDRLRNRYRPQQIEDEFGQPQPALRERLGKTTLSG